MANEILAKTIEVVSSILAEKLKIGNNSIDEKSSMDNTLEWNSLDFINIFLAINESFDIDPDTDDAIHYRSVQEIVTFVEQALAA